MQGTAQQQHFHISSADASSGTSSNLTVNLPYPLKAKRILFTHFDFQNSLYNVNSSNNGLQFVDTTANVRNATVIVSSYGTGAALATAVQTAMNAAGGTGTYAVTYSATTGKFTIAETSGPTNFGINFASGSNQIYGLLGFAATNLSGASSYTGPNVADFSGPNYLYLSSGALASGCWKAPIFRTRESGVILKIPINSAFAASNAYVNSLSEMCLHYANEISASNLDFQLLYPDGTEAQLNGAVWSLSFITYC